MKFLERVLLWFVIAALVGLIFGMQDQRGEARRIYNNIYGWIRGYR